MNIMSIPALLVLSLSLPNLAAAQSPANSVEQKLQKFKGAKAKLEADIKGFVASVNACDPPFGKNEIIEGFAGEKKNDSALKLLSLHEKNVADHVAQAEAKFANIGAGNISGVNICKGGQDAFQSQVVTPAEDASTEVVAKLQVDLLDYKRGNEEALKKEGLVRKILMARESKFGQMASTTQQLDACKKAQQYLGEDRKSNGPMKESDRALQESLVALQKVYPERVAAIREHGKMMMAGAKCTSLPLRAASFGTGEYQVADILGEGVGSAQ